MEMIYGSIAASTSTRVEDYSSRIFCSSNPSFITTPNFDSLMEESLLQAPADSIPDPVDSLPDCSCCSGHCCTTITTLSQESAKTSCAPEFISCLASELLFQGRIIPCNLRVYASPPTTFS
ncbi:hypothetical protein KIL84_016460 [Mauremys mutica]|uniref:Uncharacterized protein n=1 Tax=Mauremys mutica TaxID=74926 RepID=A0A9D4AXP8_9SAUR|nr:hypothetical protein KIL84_016460 [Mauremys mutica]